MNVFDLLSVAMVETATAQDCKSSHARVTKLTQFRKSLLLGSILHALGLINNSIVQKL